MVPVESIRLLPKIAEQKVSFERGDPQIEIIYI